MPITDDNTTNLINLDLSGALEMAGVQVLSTQGAAVADAAAATAEALVLTNLEDGSANNTLEAMTALTDYVPHASGGTTVTSNAATDLDTTAAALETFRDEQAAHNLAISRAFDKIGDEVNALITDGADIRTQLNALIARLEAHGLIAS